MKLKLFFLSIQFFFLYQVVYTQNDYNFYLNEANFAFDKGDYHSAQNLLEFIIENDNPIEVYYKYAESLRHNFFYEQASQWYKYVLEKDKNNIYSDALFWYAIMLKQMGEYENAYNLFETYIKKGSEEIYILKSKKELNACILAQNLIFDSLPIVIEHLNKNINSTFSDFNGIQLGDTAFYFSSMRPITTDNSESIIAGYSVSKIYRSKMSISGFSKAKEITSIVNDSKINSGNFSFSDDKQTLYFTRCSQQDNYYRCDIYKTTNKGRKWSKPQKLPESINDKSSSNTHPNIISIDGYEILYFSSDRKNGFGGFDIWYSIYKDNRYNQPINLGSIINTEGNEITPFYRNIDSTLYFSSDEHLNIGGFDIFYSKGTLNKWETPQNIGVPFNSPANDLYFNINEIDNDGYFTSNRAGAFFVKGKTCCNDIFYYEWNKKFNTPKTESDTFFIDTTNFEININKLLPLTLYFHNDDPDPNTLNITTEQNYKNTISNYFEMRDLYIKEHCKGLKNNEFDEAKSNIEEFFDEYLKKSFNDLEIFSKWLLKDLEKGNSAKITIKGYTSPLHTTEYNHNLALRRIGSFKNYIDEYKNGLFEQYLTKNALNGATLEFIDAPIGKTEYNPIVSDNPKDKRNSIYSKNAALERKIQLIAYESEKQRYKLPKLELPIEIINLGKVGKNTKKNIFIQYTNSGTEDLIIDSIICNSPNIKISYNKNIIKNNKLHFLKIDFNSIGIKNFFNTEIIFYTNNKNYKIIIKAIIEINRE